MKKFIIIVSIAAVLISVIVLLPPLLNPCAQMFEQTQLSIKASLDALQRGEVMLEQKQVQTLSKDSEKMAIAAEACCTAHQAGALPKGEFVACQNNLNSFDSKLQRVVVVVEDARAAKAQNNAALLAEKVAEVNTLVDSTATQAEEFIQHVEEVTDKGVDVDEGGGQIIGEDIEQAGNGGPLEWSDPHPTDYNDNFQHARLVEDPRDAMTEAIERRGDKDFFAIVTRDTKGILQVRFEQTGPTQIGPHIAIIYGGQSSERWQPQPGTDLTAELRLDGEYPIAYVGISDHDDDAFSDIPYRLAFTLDKGSLPVPGDGDKNIRIPLSAVHKEESESNDDAFKANALRLGEYMAGQIRTKGDVDFYKLDLTGQTVARVEVALQQLDASPLKPKLSLYDSDRANRWSYWTELAGADISRQGEIEPGHQVYFVAVSDVSGEAATDVPYVIQVQQVDH